MLCLYGMLVTMLVMQGHGKRTGDGDTHILTSSYSQVSHSGSARARTLSVGTPWTHSSDVHIVKGQRRKTSNKYVEDGTGEVLERFNPRPWFAYEASKDKPSDELTVPFQSFPLSLPSNNKDKPKETNKLNSYDSPYNSYNPQSQPSTKPPANFVTPNQESNDSGAADTDAIDSMGSDFSESEGPPAVPYKEHPSDDHHSPEYLDHSTNQDAMVPYKDHPSSDDHMAPLPEYLNHHPMNHDAMIPYKDHPSSDHHDAMIPYKDHPSSDHHSAPLPEYLQHDPTNHHGEHHHDYSFHHDFHNHPPIYYEVKPTTEAPEKQRLNKRPYSYYYIGRKLWYIPLYFSVYFIIYIFVLILKSIARHKITFNHYFEEDKREMKDMHEAHDEHIQQLEHHVVDDIMTARRKYIM